MEIFETMKQYHSILTNGVTELEITGSKYGCGVAAGRHIIGQDEEGNLFIDGIPAHIEIREMGEDW